MSYCLRDVTVPHYKYSIYPVWYLCDCSKHNPEHHHLCEAQWQGTRSLDQITKAIPGNLVQIHSTKQHNQRTLSLWATEVCSCQPLVLSVHPLSWRVLIMLAVFTARVKGKKNMIHIRLNAFVYNRILLLIFL